MSAEEAYPQEEPEAVTRAVEEGQQLLVDETEEATAPAPEPEPPAEGQTNLAQPATTIPANPQNVTRDPTQDEDPTYMVEPWSGLTHYKCLLDGYEDWSMPTFSQHMAVYHRGVMRVAPPGPAPEDPASETVGEAETGPGQAEETAETDTEAAPETPAEGV